MALASRSIDATAMKLICIPGEKISDGLTQRISIAARHRALREFLARSDKDASITTDAIMTERRTDAESPVTNA